MVLGAVLLGFVVWATLAGGLRFSSFAAVITLTGCLPDPVRQAELRSRRLAAARRVADRLGRCVAKC
jgi:hypothetical protein